LYLQRIIRDLPATTEIAIVIAVAFGFFILSALEPFLAGSAGGAEAMSFSDADMAFLIQYELLAALALFVFLRVRGWSFADIWLRPSWSGTWHGLLLVAASVALFYIIGTMQVFVWPAAKPVPEGQGTVSVAMIALVSLVNGHFEEIFVAGYLITAASRMTSLPVAVGISVAVRVLYHLYQGAEAILSHAALGWLFAWVYLRRRDLWPLIVAHVVLDLWAIGASALETPLGGVALGDR
jgi:uncharacterized protein